MQRAERDATQSGERGLRRRRLVVAAIGLAMVVALVVVTYRHFHGTGETVNQNEKSGGLITAAGNAADLALPPIALSAYLNTTSQATYVGSQNCRQCHDDEHATYSQTAHSRSLDRVTADREPPDGQFAHAESRMRYEAHRQDDRLWHRESLDLEGKTIELSDRPLAYRVGSGRFARTYLAEIDGFLVQSPLTWYASAEAWRMSPGYDTPEHLGFTRNANDDCLFCHAGQTTNPGGTLSRIEVQELAIGCERCHGPGSLHVARHQSGQPLGAMETDLTIVNPRSLSRELSESICQQCHLESLGSALLPGRSRDDFRPGLRWTDLCVNYDAQLPSGQMTVTGHVQQMHRSRCYQESSTLTCITCHDLHAPPTPAERPQRYRAACLSCHEDASCKLAPAARQERNANDCAACHMPSSATEVPHVAFTHHRIGIHSTDPDEPLNEHATPPFAAVLDVDHLPPVHRQRTLGLAYLRRYAHSGQDPRLVWYRQQAEELLGSVFAQGLQDESVLAGLGVIAGANGDLTQAEALAERALASGRLSPDEGVTARDLLANVLVKQQRFQEAERLLVELTRLRRDASDGIRLAYCREQRGNTAGAIAALEAVAAIDPRMPESYEVLAQLHGKLGDFQNQRHCRDRALILRARTAQ